MAAYVPIDLHRHRSVVMHMAADGEVLGWTRLANDPEALVAEVLKAGEAPEVAIEATYGWYWAVDALEAAGLNVHLVAPSRLSAFEGRRVKNDQRDCRVLGDLLRAGMLPEVWISTSQAREQRELVRYRAKLVGLRSGLKAQAHAVLAKHGVAVPMADLFGVGGRELLVHPCAHDARFHRGTPLTCPDEFPAPQARMTPPRHSRSFPIVGSPDSARHRRVAQQRAPCHCPTTAPCHKCGPGRRPRPLETGELQRSALGNSAPNATTVSAAGVQAHPPS
ncbi:MAG: transposase [Acidimicrobiales bacterium]